MDITCSPFTQASGSNQRTEKPHSTPLNTIGPASLMDVACSPLTQASGSEQRPERSHSFPPGGIIPASQMDVTCSLVTKALSSKQRNESPHSSAPGGSSQASQIDIKRSPFTKALGSEQRTGRPHSSPPGGFGPVSQISVTRYHPAGGMGPPFQTDITCFPLTQASGSEQRSEGPHTSPAGGIGPASQKNNTHFPLPRGVGPVPQMDVAHCPPTHDHYGCRENDPVGMKLLLDQCKYNWFEVVERLQCQLQRDVSTNAEMLFNKVLKLELDGDTLHLVKHSHIPYLAAEEDAYMYEQGRIAWSVNGKILSESESDDPVSYIGIFDPLSEAGKTLGQKTSYNTKEDKKMTGEPELWIGCDLCDEWYSVVCANV